VAEDVGRVFWVAGPAADADQFSSACGVGGRVCPQSTIPSLHALARRGQFADVTAGKKPFVRVVLGAAQSVSGSWHPPRPKAMSAGLPVPMTPASARGKSGLRLSLPGRMADSAKNCLGNETAPGLHRLSRGGCERLFRGLPAHRQLLALIVLEASASLASIDPDRLP
jgi:hypothetical protein